MTSVPFSIVKQVRALEWTGKSLLLLDQRELPNRENWIECLTWLDAAEAIKNMTVRGAPAIGITAAYGMALAALQGADRQSAHLGLAASRPTAVNLFWALERIAMIPEWDAHKIAEEAMAIEREDLEMNRKIGQNGQEFVKQGARILTICNTGSLATGGHGTALGIIRTAHEQGKDTFVYSCETRPRQQGLKLTAYELLKEGIPFESIADGAAASLMQAGKVDLVAAGADRIAANGDTANKIGTYMLAVLAHHHKIPFVIAAPSSTLDPKLANGSLIPIEHRDGSELTDVGSSRVAPEGTPVYNPAFDVTPGELITGIVTEQGVSKAPFRFS